MTKAAFVVVALLVGGTGAAGGDDFSGYGGAEG
jgi:hypothetical protein